MYKNGWTCLFNKVWDIFPSKDMLIERFNCFSWSICQFNLTVSNLFRKYPILGFCTCKTFFFCAILNLPFLSGYCFINKCQIERDIYIYTHTHTCIQGKLGKHKGIMCVFLNIKEYCVSFCFICLLFNLYYSGRSKNHVLHE